MFPTNPRMTPYDLFFKLLEMELQHREIKHNFPGKDLAAYARVKFNEVYGGNTGFVNGVDVAQAAKDYANYVYEGGLATTWMNAIGIY